MLWLRLPKGSVNPIRAEIVQAKAANLSNSVFSTAYHYYESPKVEASAFGDIFI